MKNLLIFVCIFFLISSCTVDKKQRIPVISISSIIKDELTLSDIAEDIRYVKLDNSVLIGKIWSVDGNESDFVLYELGGNILRYNSDGKLINKIGNNGKGPGEYAAVKDIALDKDSDRVFILDSKKVICYDFSGNYKYSFDTYENLNFDRFAFNKSEICFFCGPDFGEVKYNWVVTDCYGNNPRVKQNFHNPEIFVTYNFDLGFFKNEELFYWNYLDDTIFQVNQENAIPAYIFAKEGLRLKPSDLKDIEKLRSSPSWILEQVLGSQRFLTLNYLLLKDQVSIQAIFDEKENKFYQLNTSPLDGSVGAPNSWDSGIGFMPEIKITDQSGEWFVQYIDAWLLKAHVASDEFKNSNPKNPEKKKELEQLANSLDENDNPVLMLVKLKE